MKTKLDMFFRKILHPALLSIMKRKRKYDLTEFSNSSNDYRSLNTAKIFAVNHSNSHDAPLACEALKEHVYILAGNENLRLIDRIVFWLNGVCFFNRSNKESRKKAKNDAIDVLHKGKNLMIFPEGTWNISENKIMLPLHWGIIEISQCSECPIVPLILEYRNNKCFYSIGEPIYPRENTDKLNAINNLRDIMSTMKFNIWESFPISKREEIDKSDYKKQIEQYLAEYPLLDVEYEKNIILQDKKLSIMK